jgi:hypothetical protein
VGLSCTYDGPSDGCGQSIDYEAVCTKSGTWSVSAKYPGTSCNPPPPPQDFCSTIEPTLGSWCDTTPGLVCSYPGSCCANMYECVDNAWQSMSPPCNPPIPICPESEPAAGTPCEAPCGVVFNCEYGTCGDAGTGPSTASCNNGIWEVVQLDCG